VQQKKCDRKVVAEKVRQEKLQQKKGGRKNVVEKVQ
jgi:hypothetical protein